MKGQDYMDMALLFYLTVKVGQEQFTKNSIEYYFTTKDNTDAVYSSKMEKRGYRIENIKRRDWKKPPNYPMIDAKSRLQNTVFVIYKNDQIVFESDVLKNANALGIHSSKELSNVFQQILEK